MEFAEVVRRRRSVRRFAPNVPDPERLAQLVDIARRAPTAGFSQGVDFLVLDDPTVVREFHTITLHPDHDVPDDYVDHLPPAVVVVWSDPLRYLARYSAPDKAPFGLQDEDRWPVRFWDVDAAMAAMQLQLAAVDVGLDTWFYGIAHGLDAVRERFDVPNDRRLIGVVGIGTRADDEHPIGSGTSRPRRPLGEQLHRNRW